MKNVLIYVISIILCIAGCAKEFSYEGEDNPGNTDSTGTSVPVKSEWEFISSAKYYGPVDTAYLTKTDGGQVVTISGKSSFGNEKIFISLKSFNIDIQKGSTYTTNRQQVKFLYTGAADTIFSAIPYYGGDITVTINDIDTDRITGTFKGLAIDKDKKSQTITEGKFSSPLKTDSSAGSKGYVVLWAKEDCNGPIKVKVNGQYSEINKFTLITPECGDAGSATYTLTLGKYQWAAYCGKDSVYGQTEVKAGSCEKILVTFPFKPPPATQTNDDSCKVSDVSYEGCLFTRCDPDQTTKPIANMISSSFTGNKISGVTYTVFALGVPSTYAHPVTYTGNKIIIDANTKYKSFFETDGEGRIIRYRGLKDPATIYPLDSIEIMYEYDNNNNLVKRTVVDARYSTRKKETDFTWQNGDIIKMTDYNLASGRKNETDFEYYTDKEVHALPFTFTNAFELLLFQPLLNFGNSMNHPIKKEIIHAFDTNGTPVLKSYDFANYILDDNNYILHLRVTDNSGNFSAFSFNYKCF